jgi:hypothetical protein
LSTLVNNVSCSGEVALCHPHLRIYLLAHPELDAEGSGWLAYHSQDVSGWETFRLQNVPDHRLTQSVQYYLRLIDRVMQTPPDQIIRLLRDAEKQDRATLIGLLSDVLQPSDVENLANAWLGNSTLQSDLAHVFVDDPWATQGLTDLRAFLRSRHKPGRAPVPEHVPPQATLGFWWRLFGTSAKPHLAPPEVVGAPAHDPALTANARAIGPQLDRLAEDGFAGEFVSIGHRCLVAARRTVAPRRDLCVLATARNEGLYLLEWLAYHRSVGVDHVFVYTNNNTDGSDILLRLLARHGELSLVENTVAQGGNPQGKAYGHALSLVPELLDYRWCAIIDIDEWLGFATPRFSSMKDYIRSQELRPVDAIMLSWNNVSACGALRWQPGMLPQRFTKRFAGPDQHVKTIFKPRLFHHAMPHVPRGERGLSVICRDATGALHPNGAWFADPPRDGPAWIAHYFYRSAEEFIWKFSRGRGDNPLEANLPEINVPEEFATIFFQQFTNEALVADDRMMACAGQTEAERDRLLRLPGVAQAQEGIYALYRQRSAGLLSALHAVRPKASPAAAAFYDLLLKGNAA